MVEAAGVRSFRHAQIGCLRHEQFAHLVEAAEVNELLNTRPAVFSEAAVEMVSAYAQLPSQGAEIQLVHRSGTDMTQHLQCVLGAMSIRGDRVFL